MWRWDMPGRLIGLTCARMRAYSTPRYTRYAQEVCVDSVTIAWVLVFSSFDLTYLGARSGAWEGDTLIAGSTSGVSSDGDTQDCDGWRAERRRAPRQSQARVALRRASGTPGCRSVGDDAGGAWRRAGGAAGGRVYPCARRRV